VPDTLSNRAVVNECHLFTMSSQYMSIHSIKAGIQFSTHKPEKGKLVLTLGIKPLQIELSTDSSL